MRRLFIILVAVALAMPLVAQKKQQKVTSNNQKENNWKGAPTVAGKSFSGTIYYKVAGADVTNEAKSTTADIVESQGIQFAPSQAQSKAPKKEEQKNVTDWYYVLAKQKCYAFLNDLLFLADMNNGTILTGVKTEGEQYAAYEQRFCDLEVFPCEWMNKMATIFKSGEYEIANQNLEQFYDRTNEQKTILGFKVVRYDCKFAKASLWVAEGYDLQTWFAPFWGISHPVLEFDLVLDCEECRDRSIHFQAVKVDEGNKVGGLGEVENSIEFNDPNMVKERMMELLNKIER